MSFPRYPKYKECGVEWLGQVPEHWQIKPLKYASTHNDEVLDEGTAPDEEIAYIDISGVDAVTGISPPEIIRFGEAPSRARRRVKDGDVIISTVRTYLRSIARIKDPPENLIVSTGFAVVRPKDNSHPGFIGFLMTAGFFIENVIARSTGVSYPAINASELVRIDVPLPPLSEQTAIADFLERETGKIDGLITEQERLIELLKEKRQAVIFHAVTKGLNPDAPMKDSGIEWIGQVPEHWEKKPLKHIASINTGVAKGKDHQGRETVMVPYLRVANVQDGYLDLEEVASIEIPKEDLVRQSLKKGDVLMNEGGDFDKLGRGCIWDGQIEPCITQNHVFAVRPHDISSEWLNTITGSSYAQFYFMSRSKQSTNLASISSTNLMELPVIIPPVSDQEKILVFINEQETKCKELIQSSEVAVKLLQERRSALISAAVTGQIDVRGIKLQEAA